MNDAYFEKRSLLSQYLNRFWRERLLPFIRADGIISRRHKLKGSSAATIVWPASFSG